MCTVALIPLGGKLLERILCELLSPYLYPEGDELITLQQSPGLLALTEGQLLDKFASTKAASGGDTQHVVIKM